MKFSRTCLTVVLIGALLIGAQVPMAIAADTIKIGEINTYSKLTNFTFPYRNGWQLALEEINAAGGVMGKQLEVISRDDAGKPGDAVKIAEELVRKEKVSLLMGSFFSHVGLAMTDFAKRNKKLYVNGRQCGQSRRMMREEAVPEIVCPRDCVFLLIDGSSGRATDSIQYGPVPLWRVLGSITP